MSRQSTAAGYQSSTAMLVTETAGNTQDLLQEIVDGLAAEPRRLPCKLFYDEEGSRLFDRICGLPEYYLTRTEIAILHANSADIADRVGERCSLVEFGSGSSIKTRILLDALVRPERYVPVDISREHLLAAAERIAVEYPDLEVLPVVADYTREFELPANDGSVRSTTAFFPGSTIGNFEPEEALEFLARIPEVVGTGGGLLIGIDLQKDPRVLERAYNDVAGVTARFNRNILNVVNDMFDADFDPQGFDHRAVYDAQAGRIEMRLVSRRAQDVGITTQQFHFPKGDVIVTEYSHKYDINKFSDMVARVGFDVERVWQDPNEFFAVCYLRADGAHRKR